MKIILTLILLILCKENESSHLDIQDLSNNPGMFAINIGTSRIIEDYHLVVHKFNIDKYDQLMQKYKKKMILDLDEELETFKNHPQEHNNQLSSIISILKNKYEQTNAMLRNFKPIRTKTKRAIDLLGSVIKSITGNLDQNDYLEITNKIDELNQSSNKLINGNNAQILINEEFENRINNITEAAQKQAKEIHEFIEQSGLYSNNLGTVQQKLQLHNFIFSLDNVREQLNAIFESIQMAKLGILSRALLFPPEIDFILNILNGEGLRINSYGQAYQYLEPVAVYKDQIIHLLVKIPKFRNEKYSMLRIEPIPKNESIIQMQSKYAVVNKEESYLTNEFRLIEGEYIIKATEMYNITGNQCEHQLLRANPGECVTTYHDNNTEVTAIENYGILVKSTQAVTLENTCEFGNRNISGSFFINFRNCTVSVNGVKYENRQMQGQPSILPLNSVQIETKKIHPNAFQSMTHLHISNRKNQSTGKPTKY
ncbi:uncharacterized protein LOC118456872 [Anopheles albimanus]|uniref:uncharacterized protein LOC118456872 n=1 Tax=Anopheles albimanus TaxID=7167 RepID=UPI0016419045|nr:uncharacterized protein LOC118456872 [Anopheles albimanus]